MSQNRRVLLCDRSLFISSVRACLESEPGLVLEQVDPQPDHIRGRITAWRLDGTMFALQTNRDGNWEIYIMATDGSGLAKLTNDPADDQMPFWYP